MRKSTEERFWEKVNKDGPIVAGMTTPCWEWTGCLVNGYGTVYVSDAKRNCGTHRFSWSLHTGDVLTSDNHVCHKCDNPKCVNPEHLFKGDALANMRDKNAKGRGRYSCGESRSLTLGSRRLSPDAVMEIFNSRETGRSWTFAKKFSVSKSEVRAIWHGRAWGWLTGKAGNPSALLNLKEQR